MMNSFQNKILFFPIKVLLYFLLFSVLLFIVGPVNYPVDNSLITVGYLLLVNWMLFKGYKKGIIRGRLYTGGRHTNYGNVIKFILLLSCFFLFLRIVDAAQTSSLSVIIQKTVQGIISPNEGYYAKLEKTHVSTITYFLMLMSPITSASLPLGVFYWKRLNSFYRAVVLILVLGNIAFWLILGTRKGLFDILIVLFFTVYAAYPNLIVNKIYKKKLIIGYVSCLTLFIVYFLWSTMGRYDTTDITDIGDSMTYNINPLYQDVSRPLVVGLSMLESYLCQGYYALSCALEEFSKGVVCFTFGLGNNFFTANLLERLDIDIIQYTYQGLLMQKYNIDPYVNWHSIYVWLANDFTFIGVPFILYIIGYWFAVIWKSVLHQNFFAIPIFMLFVQMIAYSFANNQVLSFSFIPLFFWFLLFIYKR